MDKIMRKILCMALIAGLICSVPVPAWAGQVEAGENSDDIVISENDEPYLALGADLTAEQQKTVLDLMGIEASDLDQYDVVYVNNEEEHEYLDDYIASSEIGTRSLSSVVIVKTEKGSGVNVSTYNINYCTAGMYKNALATAGIEDADIIVAGPFPLSGTAALVGVFKAYKEMTGESLDEDAVDAAMDELVTTGIIEESIDGDPEKVEAMIAELKEMIANGELADEEDIREAIDSASEKYGLNLSQDDIDKLLSLLMKLKDLDIDWGNVIDQAKDWAKVINDKFGDQIKEAVTSEGFWDKVASFFQKIIDALKSLFT